MYRTIHGAVLYCTIGVFDSVCNYSVISICSTDVLDVFGGGLCLVAVYELVYLF